MVQHGWFDVKHVNHDGNDRNDALIHRRSCPGSPTALGTAGHDKAVHFDLVPFRAGAERGDGVEGAHGRFGHWEPGGPFRVTRP